MNTKLKFAAAAASLVFFNFAYAGFIEDLHAKFPNTQNAKVEKAFGNFFSVVRGSEVVFINEDLTILINGDVVDLATQRSLTNEIREANKPKIKTSDLNLKDAIKIGSGKNKLYVFSDPDCPYCQQLESNLKDLKDATVYIFPMPLVQIHPNARTIAESIWCSRDRATAWREYLINKKQPERAVCDNPISRNLLVAERYQIQGTPALVFEDGTLIPGFVPVSRIESQFVIAGSRK